MRLLSFAFVHQVGAVYIECLQDAAHKQGHYCYNDRYGEPRASYDAARRVARVIDGGYRVDIGGGRGQQLTKVSGATGMVIVCACGDADGRGMGAAAYASPLLYKSLS